MWKIRITCENQGRKKFVLEKTILNFVSHFGYTGLFGILIGVPVQIKYLASQGKMNYFLSIVTGALGSFTGMSLSYFLMRDLDFYF
jgi:membrane protein DedA with SNARE-associated domain